MYLSSVFICFSPEVIFRSRVFAINKIKTKFTQKNLPEGTKLNELGEKRPGTSQMSERLGPNFAPGSFALQQSIRLVYMLRALSRGRNRATRATRDNQDAHTDRAHARQRRHNTTASPRLRRGAGRRSCRAPAAAAAVAAAAAAAAVLLLLCCSCTAAAASRSAMHRGAQRATTDCFSFCVFGNARRSE